MGDIQEINQLHAEIKRAIAQLSIEQKSRDLKELHEQATASDFWADNERASLVMQDISKLEQQTSIWTAIERDVSELKHLAEMKDPSLENEITEQYDELAVKFATLKKQLQFSGPYDDYDVLFSIHAGAGGTDAQDWAAMLMRMYTRWAEQNEMKATVLNESPGEEAGLKSVELEISGSFAYGKLKGENGVHRLVRLSPFNADAKRQTSFAKVEIMPKINKPDAVPLEESDLKIDVFRAGGHGGQSVNTTDSAVRVTHLPTGIVVSIQNERSQIQNKETALTILRSKLVQLQLEQHAEKISELKGPNEQAAWGNQIRSYVLHPYTMVKDLRTRYETTNAQGALDGDINPFIDAYLEHTLSDNG